MLRSGPPPRQRDDLGGRQFFAGSTSRSDQLPAPPQTARRGPTAPRGAGSDTGQATGSGRQGRHRQASGRAVGSPTVSRTPGATGTPAQPSRRQHRPRILPALTRSAHRRPRTAQCASPTLCRDTGGTRGRRLFPQHSSYRICFLNGRFKSSSLQGRAPIRKIALLKTESPRRQRAARRQPHARQRAARSSPSNRGAPLSRAL